jgi:hypothetical protein
MVTQRYIGGEDGDGQGSYQIGLGSMTQLSVLTMRAAPPIIGIS